MREHQPDEFMKMLGDYDHDRIRLLVTQQVEGDEVEAGMDLLRQMCAIASADKREEVPVSELRVGLKCGGSDGFSGITANPLVGEFSDRGARDVWCRDHLDEPLRDA